jgi:hypothetical protein
MIVNGNELLFHSVLLTQMEALLERCPAQRTCEAVLSSVALLMFEKIPRHPDQRPFCRHALLERSGSRWRRAGFLSHYHLFYWHDARARRIVYAWIHDTRRRPDCDALHAEGSFEVFDAMVTAGCPPRDWADLARRRKIGMAAGARRESRKTS